jgi:glycosyltransferase involved in cell wall biosynthesis
MRPTSGHFTLLSHALPPAGSGQAMILYQLLRGFDPASYRLVASPQQAGDPLQGNWSARLPARYHQLPPEFELRRGTRYGLATPRAYLNMLLHLLLRTRRMISIIQAQQSQALIACTGDLYNLPAGFFSSHMTRRPFYAYIFDDYAGQWTNPLQQRFARSLEPLMLRRAAGVIVLNEFHRDKYRVRYGIEAGIVRVPCDTECYAVESAAAQDDVRIVYTGAVYDAHFDAFHNLLAVLQSCERADIRLHLYTAQSPADLANRGIRGPVCFHQHQQVSDIPAIQQAADLLFLPLAFASPYPEVVRTAAPTKMGEYLASGRPILVHAPADSFVSWYFRRHNCGLVVDQPDPAALRAALQRMLHDAALRRQLGERARECARRDFSLPVVRAAFRDVLQGAGGA